MRQNLAPKITFTQKIPLRQKTTNFGVKIETVIKFYVKKYYMLKHITHFGVKIVTLIKFCVQKCSMRQKTHFGAKTQLLRRRKKLKRKKNKNKYVAPFYRSIIFKNTNQLPEPIQ